MRYLIVLLLLIALSTSACAQRSPSAGSKATVASNPTHYDLSAYPKVTQRVSKSEAEWRALLAPTAFNILRQAGTEYAGTGSLLKNHDQGVYKCAGCGNPLFSSATKFESGTGWPSFWAPIEADRVEEKTDGTMGMQRTEVLCARCGGHLGHVFDDGPKPTGLRYCMNSAALAFDKK